MLDAAANKFAISGEAFRVILWSTVAVHKMILIKPAVARPHTQPCMTGRQMQSCFSHALWLFCNAVDCAGLACVVLQGPFARKISVLRFE